MKHGEEFGYFAFRKFVRLSPIDIFIPFAFDDSPLGRSTIVLWFAKGVLEWVEDHLEDLSWAGIAGNSCTCRRGNWLRASGTCRPASLDSLTRLLLGVLLVLVYKYVRTLLVLSATGYDTLIFFL